MIYNFIIEGDSLDVLKKMDDESIDIVVTSPPYNAAHDYDNYNDNKDKKEYLSNMKSIFSQIHRVLKKDGRICLNVPFAIKNRETKKVTFLAHTFAGLLNSLGFQDFEWITWHKGKNKNHFQGNNTAWGSWKSPSCPSFRPMGEAVMVFFKDERRMVRDKSDIDITGDEFKNWTKNLWYFDEDEDNIYEPLLMIPNTASKKEHPAPYPVELVERLLKLYSYQNSIVLDPFNGIGTTTYAANSLNRKFIGIELSKKYCDIAHDRLKDTNTKRLTMNKNFQKLVNSSNVNNSLNKFFPYKESFSPELYTELKNRYSLTNIRSMYDPFLGTGSSLLNDEIKDVYGVDVSPFALNVSTAKLRKLEFEEIKKAKLNATSLKDLKISNYPFPIWKPYPKYADEKKFNIIKSVIKNFYSISETVGFFIEYLIYSNLETIFDYKRDGNGIKFRKSKIDEKSIYEYLENLITEALDKKSIFDKNNSIENIELEINTSTEYQTPNSVDLVITSPPYVNMFDYFEVYKMELWTSGIVKNYKEWRRLKKSALRSNRNTDISAEDIIDNNILVDTIKKLEKRNTDQKTINMINNYFFDMRNVLKCLYKSLKKDSYAFIVVGNSFYSGVPVITDFILAEEASKMGFKNEDIILARKLRTSPQQMKIITDSDRKYLRESIIVLKR